MSTYHSESPHGQLSFTINLVRAVWLDEVMVRIIDVKNVQKKIKNVKKRNKNKKRLKTLDIKRSSPIHNA